MQLKIAILTRARRARRATSWPANRTAHRTTSQTASQPAHQATSHTRQTASQAARRARPRLTALCVALAALLAFGCGCALSPGGGAQGERLNQASRPFDLASSARPGQTHTPQANTLVELDIVSIGDILFHYPWQLEYNPNGSAAYPEYFMYLKDSVQAADIALCNVEGPLAGGALSGYPLFNIGDSMAPAVKEAGFDVVYTAHNHLLDQGGEAVFRTLEVLRGAGLLTAGTRLSANEPNFALYETSKGIKIAVCAYVYESGERQVNGLPVWPDMDPFINSYTWGSAADLAEIKEGITAARNAGADLVISYFHNGIEYAREPSAEQREMAQFVANNGADIVFASHPHVIQPMELLHPEDNSAPVPVFWAMGNYVSGQVVEWGMEPANEEGIMAQVHLGWNPQTREVDTLKMCYLPLWNTFYDEDGRRVHTAIPELGTLAQNPSILASGYLERAQSAFAEVHATMGEGSLNWERA